jgi:hypothetical protein
MVDTLSIAKVFLSGIAYVVCSCNVETMCWVGEHSIYLVFQRWAEIVDMNSKDGM